MNSKIKKKYIFLDHKTDAFIESYGDDINEAFENATLAMMDLMIDLDSIDIVYEELISVVGEDYEKLLYNWLESILLKSCIDQVLFKSFHVKISENTNGFILNSTVCGEKLNYNKHKLKIEIKSPTYHEMKIILKPHSTIRYLLDL